MMKQAKVKNGKLGFLKNLKVRYRMRNNGDSIEAPLALKHSRANMHIPHNEYLIMFFSGIKRIAPMKIAVQYALLRGWPSSAVDLKIYSKPTFM